MVKITSGDCKFANVVIDIVYVRLIVERVRDIPCYREVRRFGEEEWLVIYRGDIDP